MGPCMRSSVGLAPNRFLAKLGSDMQKPDGLTLIRASDLPERLYGLTPRDLPGIGSKMEERLRRYGILTLQQLCALSRPAMHELWGGIWGDRYAAWLRGEETEEPPSKKHTLGHSHVLEPVRRTYEGALKIAKKLTEKTALRLRKLGYWAGGFSVSVQLPDNERWERHAKLEDTQDTGTFLQTLVQLWDELPKSARPIWVGVACMPLVPPQRHNLPLFGNPKRERLSTAMDDINERHGKHTAYYASLSDTFEDAPTRIAFSRVPDLSEF
jgi:DNA polymerase IV